MTRTRRPKTPWYTHARLSLERWKRETPSLPLGARSMGTTWIEAYRRRKEVGPYPICLPTDHADLNLLPDIRQQALDRFERHDIRWHGWTPGPGGLRWPSSHLLDSQVQCVNVLLSLARTPGALLDLVRLVEPAATTLLAIEDDSPVAFEWIGAADYLQERRGKPRHRGRDTTSADAFLLAQREDGGRTGVLVEWKFTEDDHGPAPSRASGGAPRAAFYRPHYRAARSHFAHAPPLEAFHHKPHDQLLREALLAAAMLGARERAIDRAVLLHLVPAGNRTLRAEVPEGLATLGSLVEEVWCALLPGPYLRYACLDTSAFYGATPDLSERYGALAARR